MEYRIEQDTMGEVKVPKHALYRAQTQRAVENFPISGTRLEKRTDNRAGQNQESGSSSKCPAGHS